MANPVIVNVAPAPGSVAKVLAPARFSIRSSSLEIDRSTVTFYRGAGPVFYDAASGILPENHEDLTFKLFALEGIVNNLSDRAIVGTELEIAKTAGVAQEALYLMGGLEAPADPEAILMVEFTVRIPWSGVTHDNDDSGVRVGLWAGDSGVTVRFRGGVNPRAIELWDAAYSTASRPIVGGDPYRYVYDWDDQTDTYKLLWHPRANLVRLYRSTGQGATTTDDLIIDGEVSDFPSLPAEEQRIHPPWVFFGHSTPAAISTSYWSNVYLFNVASAPIYNGLPVGEQAGLVQSDQVCEYRATTAPEDAEQPWSPLPDSFGQIGTSKRLDNNWLTLQRDSVLDSIGFFREETRLDTGITVFDFTFRGELDFIQSGTQNTGMEFYIDNGVAVARVALLWSDGVSYLGIFTGGDPKDVASYAADIVSWHVERTFRLTLDPAGQTVLSSINVADEGVDEEYFVGVLTSGLPASEMPGPGIGFLHNANTSEAKGALRVKRVRYSTDLRSVDSTPIPVAWTEDGTGVQSDEDGYVTLESTSQGDHFFYYREETVGDSENGVSVEFRTRVTEYSIDGEESPIRAMPGVGMVINDETNHLAVLFADAGPPDERIVFLAETDTDYAATLLKIRAGDATVEGIYAGVDWTEFHLYRFHRTPAGRLRLFIDNSATPSIDLEDRSYSYPASETVQWQIKFGNVLSGALVTSQWKFLRYNISKGFDFSVAPIEGGEPLFSHAFNNLIEAESV